MKNKLLIAVITSATLLSLCSCSKKEETIPTTTKETTSIVQTTKETTTKETTTQETETTTIPETTTQAQETTTEIPTETTTIQGPALFEEVYAPYALTYLHINQNCVIIEIRGDLYEYKN